MSADHLNRSKQFISASTETPAKVPKVLFAGLIGYMAFDLYTNDNLFLIRDALNLANGTLGTP
ncbi:MAG: hypothetical protein QG623_567 [Patescibacteria group bacterium]|nr:hypothetical protein [Patescibacteria group bacterium]